MTTDHIGDANKMVPSTPVEDAETMPERLRSAAILGCAKEYAVACTDPEDAVGINAAWDALRAAIEARPVDVGECMLIIEQQDRDCERLQAALTAAEGERDEAHGVIGEVAFQGKAGGFVLLHAKAPDPFWRAVAGAELRRRASTSTDREVGHE